MCVVGQKQGMGVYLHVCIVHVCVCVCVCAHMSLYIPGELELRPKNT